MSSLKRDNMRMPTVGSNDQLARTTVGGKNPFSKLKLRLPGARPLIENPYLNGVMSGRFQTIMAQHNKKAEAPFYGRTGALYKPEFGPVVGKIPHRSPIKASPAVPDPALMQKIANSIHVKNFTKEALSFGAVRNGFNAARSALGFGARAAPAAAEATSALRVPVSNATRFFGREGFNPFFNRVASRAATLNAGRAAGNAAPAGLWQNIKHFAGAPGRFLRTNPTAAGIWNSRAVGSAGSALQGSLLGAGVDAVEDMTGYDTGVNWTMAGAGAGGLGRLIGGRRMFSRVPGLRAGNQLMQGANRLSPVGIPNATQAAGWGLGMTGLAYPMIKDQVTNYAQQQGVNAFRNTADTFAQGMGFNDAMSALASPVGRAIFGYQNGGLSGAASGMFKGFTTPAEVSNGQTMLPSGLSSDEVWAGLSSLLQRMQQEGVQPEQQKSVLTELLGGIMNAPSEVERQAAA